MSSDRSFRPSTLAIHAGAPRDLHASSILLPIHQTTAYVQKAVGVHKGRTYSRTSNPTVDALEQTIAAFEGTPATLCFRSGMAAITTLCLSLLKSGDHVIISEVVYRGTIRLFRQVLGGLASKIRHRVAVDFSRRPRTRNPIDRPRRTNLDRKPDSSPLQPRVNTNCGTRARASDSRGYLFSVAGNGGRDIRAMPDAAQDFRGECTS